MATYTVKPGDSLSKIAAKVYGDPGQWVVLAFANGIAPPHVIQPGQVLQLPPPPQPLRPAAPPVTPGDPAVSQLQPAAGARPWYKTPWPWVVLAAALLFLPWESPRRR